MKNTFINMINNKKKIIFSCSSNPSNFGCKIYNYIFKRYNLDYIYIPIKTIEPVLICNTMKGMNIYGASISMPMKNLIIKHLDRIDKYSQITQSVNTVINKNGLLCGYNSDYIGFQKTVEKLNLNNVAIYGSGSVVDSIVNVLLLKNKVKNIDVYARNKKKCKKLNLKYKLGKNDKSNKYDLFINATPLDLNRTIKSLVIKSDCVFDVKVSIKNTELINFAKSKSVKNISGFQMYKYQLQKQLQFYTGLKLNEKSLSKLINNSLN